MNAFNGKTRERTGTLTTRHRLLTTTWAADVEHLEDAIWKFADDRSLPHDCRVDFFEMSGDAHLHVNVTHHDQTTSIAGWAGPGRVADGFIHNRRFLRAPASRMIRDIRAMIFAPRVSVPDTRQAVL